MTATTTAWQPDWPTLERTADTLVASDPLAARVAAVTPPGSHVSIALRADLRDLVAASTSGGVTVVAVDTLTVPAGDTVIEGVGLSIMARSIVVDGADATLRLRTDQSGASVQITTAGITGTLRAAFESADGTATPGAGGTFTLAGGRAVEVLTVTAGGGPPAAVSDRQSVADSLHEPWSLVALGLSGAIGGTLVDQRADEATALAQSMLQWVAAGCSALLAERSQFPTLDVDDLACLQSSTVGLLAFTQSLGSGATYVPALSTSTYQQQIDALLAAAATYDAKISAFRGGQDTDALLASFAHTLAETYADAQAPLLKDLARLADEAGSVEAQLNNAAVQLKQVGDTLQACRQALLAAIDEKVQHDLVMSAIDTFITVITLYVGAAGVLLGDPEILTGKSAAAVKAALEITEKLIDAGQSLQTAITTGATAAGSLPNPATSEATAQGAQYLTGSLAGFGSAVALLWGVVARLGSGSPAGVPPGLVAAVDQLPDLSGMSLAGLDPVTYWAATVVQTRAAVKAHEDLPEATAYLEAVELAATYGSAVGDLQMKLLQLYTQGMSAFDQLQATVQAQDRWTALQKELSTTEDRARAAAGLLERGYLNVKRSLVLAVENYRAAFLYQWLQPAVPGVNVSMDLVALRERSLGAVTGLAEVLAGKVSGPVRPRQPFQLLTYQVRQETLFTEVDGKGQAQFTIDPSAFAEQLDGDTAVYLTAATFTLEGAGPSADVALHVATSGHYANQLGESTFRFVSRPVSMTNIYKAGDPPRFVTQWQYADAASYLTPTPYTSWTVTVDRGDWRSATGIGLTLSGVLLQKP